MKVRTWPYIETLYELYVMSILVNDDSSVVFSSAHFEENMPDLKWQVFLSDDNLRFTFTIFGRHTPAVAVAQHAISKFLTLHPK